MVERMQERRVKIIVNSGENGEENIRENVGVNGGENIRENDGECWRDLWRK